MAIDLEQCRIIEDLLKPRTLNTLSEVEAMIQAKSDAVRLFPRLVEEVKTLREKMNHDKN